MPQREGKGLAMRQLERRKEVNVLLGLANDMYLNTMASKARFCQCHRDRGAENSSFVCWLQ